MSDDSDQEYVYSEDEDDYNDDEDAEMSDADAPRPAGAESGARVGDDGAPVGSARRAALMEPADVERMLVAKAREVPPESAEVLLRHVGWSAERLMEAFWSDGERLTGAAGVDTSRRDGSWIDVQFLKTANEMVIDCRRVLKNTYVFGYYLPTPWLQQRALENLQGTSALHGDARDDGAALDQMDRSEIVNVTRVTESFLANLIQGAEAASARAVRARSPSANRQIARFLEARDPTPRPWNLEPTVAELSLAPRARPPDRRRSVAARARRRWRRQRRGGILGLANTHVHRRRARKQRQKAYEYALVQHFDATKTGALNREVKALTGHILKSTAGDAAVVVSDEDIDEIMKIGSNCKAEITLRDIPMALSVIEAINEKNAEVGELFKYDTDASGALPYAQLKPLLAEINEARSRGGGPPLPRARGALGLESTLPVMDGGLDPSGMDATVGPQSSLCLALWIWWYVFMFSDAMRRLLSALSCFFFDWSTMCFQTVGVLWSMW
ncbi:hypothetical protein JL720_15480 [Aureococcus anophagefferens]|nr:hypothetical protein JL720_15480 [Aureococcus anophagefferens]